MESIYGKNKSIYEIAQIDRGLPENVAGPKAAYTVLAQGQNTPDMATRSLEIERELTANEVSSQEAAITESGAQQFRMAQNNEAVSIATSDAPVEDRIEAVTAVREAEYQPNLVEEAVINQASQFDPMDATEDEIHKRRVRQELLVGVAGSILNSQRVLTEINNIREEITAELTGDQAGAATAAEFGEAIFLPGAIGEMYNNVINDLFPEAMSNIGSFTLPGEAQEFMTQQFQGLEGQELTDKLELMKESLIENAGILTDNGFLANMMINEVFAEELGIRGEGDFNWDRFWNNATGILDTTVVLGAAARAGTSFAKSRSFGKVASLIERNNPQLARDLEAAILSSDSGSEVGRMIGMTPEDTMVGVLPSYAGALNSNTPANIVESIRQAQTNLTKIEEDIAFGINYTQEEIAAMQSRVLDAYTEIQGSYNQSFSQLQLLEDEGRGFVIKAAIGRSDDTGFGSYQQARDHFESNFAEGTRVDYMVRDGDLVREATPEDLTGSVVSPQTYSRAADARRGANRAGVSEVEIVRTEDGRYQWQTAEQEVWYRVEQEYQYNVGLLDENTLLFGGQPIDSANSFSEGRAFGSRYLLDPASRFDRLTAKAASRASDMGQGIRGRLLNQFRANFMQLPRNEQVRVMDVMDQGSELQRNFDVHELQGMGLTDRQITSYYDIRGIMDVEWRMNNTRVYNTLKREGYESVVNPATGFEEFGRRVAQSDVNYATGRARVYDPDSNQIIRLTEGQVQRLYENGGTIMRAKSPVKAGDEAVTQIAQGLGNGTRIRPLNLNPLSYRPGYVTRFYDENYFIKMRKTEIVDGVKQERLVTVAAAPTNPQASKLIEALKAQNPDADFVKQLDKSLDQAESFENEYEYLRRSGGIITGRRGDILKGIDDSSARTIDPVQSMMDSISYTAQRVSHDDTIASMERRWVNTYGKKFGQHKEGKQHFTIPEDLKDIKGDTPTAAGVQQARDYASYVQALKGTQGDAAQAWRSAMISVAEHMDNIFDSSRVGKVASDVVRNFNPIKSLRGLAFNVLLASNPMRQILLQANQITFLTGMAPKYIAGGELARDFTAFMVAAGTRNRPIWGSVRPRLAKMMKMSENDFEAMYDGYVRSGLPFSIDSHTFARDGLQDLSVKISGNAAQRSGRMIGNAVKWPILKAKSLGFDAGEWSNLTMTWLVAMNDWRKKNPGRDWRTKGALDDISTEARDLGLNMTRTGELPYQRGFLSLSTQFLSYQHKALLVLAGRNKAYQSLTKQQRIGMGVAQFLLYGADGFGMGVQWEKLKDNLGMDIPESANNVLDGLAYEFMLNHTINALTQDGTDINFSGTLAPGSGVLSSFSDFIGGLMSADLPTTLLGASGSAISRVDQAVRMVGTVWDIPDLSNPERLEATLQQAGQIFGGYSNYVRGRAMMEVGYAVSNSGQPLFRTTYAEGMAKALFGVGPESEQDYYRVLQDVNGQFTGEKFLDSVGGPSSSDIDDIAETYYSRVMKIYQDMSYDTIDGRDDLWYNQLESKIALENTVMAVLPPDVAYAVKKRIHDRISRNINTTGVDDLVQYMAGAVLGGTQATSTREHYVNLLKQADFNYTPEQIQDIEALVDYMIDEEGLQ